MKYDGEDVGTVKQNSVSSSGQSLPKTHNSFGWSPKVFQTQRFGDIQPFFFYDGVPNDRKLSFRNMHSLNAFPLKSPLLNDIYYNKDYFRVPRKCILPNAWDYIYRNPIKGNDVPDDVNSLFDVKLFLKKCIGETSESNLWNQVIDTGAKAESFMYRLLLLSVVISNGSLFDVCRCPLTFVFVRDDSLSRFFYNVLDFDALWLQVYNKLHTIAPAWSMLVQFTDASAQNVFWKADNIEDFRKLLYFMFSGSHTFGFPVSSIDAIESLRKAFKDVIETNYSIQYFDKLWAYLTSPDLLNIYRIIAYQLVCAQYFTNDSIDEIYSAQRWMDNQGKLVGTLFGTIAGAEVKPTFRMDGVDIPYDVHSKKYLSRAMDEIPNILNGSDIFYYFMNLFSFNFSLRQGDYFMTGKVLPLAVGDNNIAVVNNKVNVVDVTRSIVMQRFRNAVNQVGSDLKDYMKKVFGVEPHERDIQPYWIASCKHRVNEVGLESTASSSDTPLGTRVSNLMHNDSRYEFTVDIDDASLVIGLSSFEVEQVYPNAVDLHNVKNDRFEMFNPAVQNIGDQDLKANMLSPDVPRITSSGVWCYKGRYAEYKESFSSLHGGFRNNLPSWSFQFRPAMFDGYGSSFHINSQFIRHFPTEMDKFCTILTGITYGNYFHFIISYRNQLEVNRPMFRHPGIL